MPATAYLQRGAGCYLLPDLNDGPEVKFYRYEQHPEQSDTEGYLTHMKRPEMTREQLTATGTVRLD